MTQSRFAALPTRQKVSAVIFFLIGIFILYEVIGMFRGGGSQSSGSTVVASKAAPKPTAAAAALPPPPASGTATKPGMPTNMSPLASSPTPPAGGGNPILSKPMVEIVPPSSPSLVEEEKSQGHYLSALNELQMLKIQREIAETTTAIVSAKLATVTAEKNISDILTNGLSQPGTSAGTSAGPPSSTGIGPSALGPQASPPPSPAPSAAPPPSPPPLSPPQPSFTPSNYTVQSVSMELDQWHAVLSAQGKLYDVTVGDVLPEDGATVSAIDQKGVTLTSGGVEQRVPLVSSETYSTSTSTGPSPSPPPSPPPSPSSPALAPPK